MAPASRADNGPVVLQQVDFLHVVKSSSRRAPQTRHLAHQQTAPLPEDGTVRIVLTMVQFGDMNIRPAQNSDVPVHVSPGNQHVRTVRFSTAIFWAGLQTSRCPRLPRPAVEPSFVTSTSLLSRTTHSNSIQSRRSGPVGLGESVVLLEADAADRWRFRLEPIQAFIRRPIVDDHLDRAAGQTEAVLQMSHAIPTGWRPQHGKTQRGVAPWGQGG